MAQTAIGAGITSLYHYEAFNTEYLEDLLTKQRVHCSDPASLNDPWDCRPWFDPEVLEDSDVRDHFIAWIFSELPATPVAQEQIIATQARIREDSDYRRGILEAFSTNFLELIPGRWRIYCLTPIADSTLMWSHYGDNHRGIALECSTDNPMFGTAQKVRYLASYPRWSPHHLLTSPEPHVLLTKSVDWAYEHEYRLISLSENIKRAFTDHPLLLRDGFLSLPVGALRSVIAGCESDYAAISELVKRCCPTLPVRRVVRAPDKYKLKII